MNDPLIAVGNPTPELHWKAHGRPIPENKRIRQLPDGSLQIVSVKNGDTGNYTCMVQNKFGQHMVTHELLVNGPPAPPSVLLTSQTTNSVTLKLKQVRNSYSRTYLFGCLKNDFFALLIWFTLLRPVN